MSKFLLTLLVSVVCLFPAKAQDDSLRKHYARIVSIDADSTVFTMKMLSGDIPGEKQKVEMSTIMISCGIGTFPFGDALVSSVNAADSTAVLNIVPGADFKKAHEKINTGMVLAIDWKGNAVGTIKNEENLWKILFGD